MLRNKSQSIEQSAMKIVANEQGKLASLYGRIDIDSSAAIRGRLLALFEAQHPKIISVDLSGVTHMDSSGIATLIEALRIARSYNTEVRLQGLEGRLLRLFQSTGILRLFNGSTRSLIKHKVF